ncbi:MAG TPA: FtsX-like permease family protein [Candidatus Saccharimonadales bacterium]
MSTIIRGIKNTFRNGIRTIGIAIILAVSLSLGFSMLLANKAVAERGAQLRQTIGANMMAFPAGSSGGLESGRPFTEKEVEKIKNVANVKHVHKLRGFVIQAPQDAKKAKETSSNIESFSQSSDLEKPPTTNLRSAVDPSKEKPPFNKFPIPPISAMGLEGNIDPEGKRIVATKGRFLRPQDTLSAVVGKELAEKNKLKVGSSFTIKDKRFTVVGIFDSGTLYTNNAVVIPFKTAQQLLDKKNEIPQVIVEAASIEALTTVKEAITAALGKDRVDMMPLRPEAVQLVESLKAIESISLATLIVSLGAALITILTAMLLVVRERAKEIGILKALGGTNTKIVTQFLTEATVLTMLSALMAIVFAALSSNTILKGILDSRISSQANEQMGGVQAIGGPAAFNPTELVANLSTVLDWHFVLLGLGIALGIALIGTALPAFIIAKVRPAQIMRGN